MDIDFNRETVQEGVGHAAVLASAMSGGLETYDNESSRLLAEWIDRAELDADTEALGDLIAPIAHTLFGLALIARGAMDAAERLGGDRQEIMRDVDGVADSFFPEA